MFSLITSSARLTGGRPLVQPSTNEAKCSRSRGRFREMKRRSAKVKPKRSARDIGSRSNAFRTALSTRAAPMICWSPPSDAMSFTSLTNGSPNHVDEFLCGASVAGVQPESGKFIRGKSVEPLRVSNSSGINNHSRPDATMHGYAGTLPQRSVQSRNTVTTRVKERQAADVA